MPSKERLLEQTKSEDCGNLKVTTPSYKLASSRRRRTSLKARQSVADTTFLLTDRERKTCTHDLDQNLELAAIGNCNVHFLCNSTGSVVYGCLPEMNSDPVFNALIHQTKKNPSSGAENDVSGLTVSTVSTEAPASARRLSKPSKELLQYSSFSPEESFSQNEDYQTLYKIEIEDFCRAESDYFPDTAILVTYLYDKHGNSLRITDFCPLYEHYERSYNPPVLVRMLNPRGSPRIKVKLRINEAFGERKRASRALGSNHILYNTSETTFRLTTDIPPIYINNERFFVCSSRKILHLGTAEPLHDNLNNLCRFYFEKTTAYWENFTRSLILPLEWQEEVIRAAITLKLCQNWSTGAIIAAMTTSIPESDDDKGRNWDYRYCWVRDSFHTVQSLNKLGQSRIMERYLEFILNILHDARTNAASSEDREYKNLQPLYGIFLEKDIEEKIVPNLSGYRGFGPVRIGNAAYFQQQNDTYGSIILSVKQLFFDSRLRHKPRSSLFQELEKVGEVAYSIYKSPDAGIWELRGSQHIHTHSTLMCWAACDSLSKMAEIMKLCSRKELWEIRAQEIEMFIKVNAWNEHFQTFIGVIYDHKNPEQVKEKAALNVETLPLDASLLLMGPLGLCAKDDTQYIATVERIGELLMHENFLFRYKITDDFGAPKNSFIVCTFWYIEALAFIGKAEAARELFENLLNYRNRFGILSEDLDIDNRELWGNFPQAYSMVGVINSALILSKPWSSIGL